MISIEDKFEEIFNNNPRVQIIEVLGYDELPWVPVSSDGRIYKIRDDTLISFLAGLSGSLEEQGCIISNGYRIGGKWMIAEDGYKFTVTKT